MLFLWRGPWRAIHNRSGDFAAPYIASLRFSHDLNPYSPEGFNSYWYAAGASSDYRMNDSDERPVYPPSTLILMVPLARLHWSAALSVYVFGCTLLYGYLLYALAGLIDGDWTSWKRWGFLAYGLALAPVHTGLAVGNLSILAFIFCMYSLLLAHKKKDLAAGVLLAVALCLKPTTGILLVPYFLFSRRWKLLGVTAGISALICVAAMLHMRSIPYAWHADYQQNIAYLFGPDGVANFATDDFMRFDLINLQVPLFGITHSKAASNLLSWLVVSLLAAAWVWIFVRKDGLRAHWEPAAGAIVLLGLLPIYQRTYNAGFVLIALLWAFKNLEQRAARWILAVSVIFLMPGESLLRKSYGYIPHALWQSTFWSAVVMPQATWGVVLLVLLLLAAMANCPKRDAEPQ